MTDLVRKSRQKMSRQPSLFLSLLQVRRTKHLHCRQCPKRLPLRPTRSSSSSSQDHDQIISGETSTSLIIPSLGVEDVANYACNASNIAGYEYKNVIVNILTIGALIKEGPKPTLIASTGPLTTSPPAIATPKYCHRFSAGVRIPYGA